MAVASIDLDGITQHARRRKAPIMMNRDFNILLTVFHPPAVSHHYMSPLPVSPGFSLRAADHSDVR